MRSTVGARIARVMAVFSVAAGLVTFVASGVGHAEVPPVVDYGSYPPSLPATCTASGSDLLVGEQFTVGGAVVSDLRNLAVQPGDTIVMTWDSFAPGCEGIGVGFSSKVATVPVFDASTDYWLHEYSYCGPETGATPCTAPFRLTVRVPSAALVPCYQIDAHAGAPLGVVGPSGAFYGILNGTRNLLISALNGGTGSCTPLPPCPGNPTLPATAFLCTSQATTTTAPPTTAPPTTAPPTTAPPTTTTTAPPPTTSTSAPVVTVPPTTAPPTTAPPTSVPPTTATTGPQTPPRCAVNPALPADSPGCVPCPSNPALAADSPSCTRVAGTSLATSPALPRTGRDTGSLALTGVLFLFAGLCLAFAYRRPAAPVA